jgi:spore photoproduct lyase
MDCSYCILQGYYHPPVLQYFINQDKLYRELNAAFEMRSLLRIGTGEFTDSLIWESWTDLTPNLVRLFGQQMHAVLELKTKTTAIDRLKSIRHQRKTILSWSLNTPRIISTQERGTATLAARLRAAAQCQQWGYPLAFHFDPMIIYPGCAEEYFDVLKALFKSVSSSNIVWISLGTLRFMPFMQTIIKQRFPESNIIYGEFIPGLDGKMRYFKSLRINLYQRMVEWIRSMAPDLLVYLCMEDDVVWQQSFGFSPENSETLSSLLDASAKKYCDLK